MANDLNDCKFIGRLGQDPDIKYMPSGDPVANLSIACGWKSKEKEGTEWVRVVAFGKLADIIGKYLKKGSQVYISGSMRTRSWEKDGQKHYSTEIVADKMQMLGGKSDGQQQSGQSSGGYGGDPAPTSDFDSDIPFAKLSSKLY